MGIQFINQQPAYKRYSVGNYSYGSPRIIDFPRGTKLSIGKYCSIAEGVVIMLGSNHHVEWVTTSPLHVICNLPHLESQLESPLIATKGDIAIGNDVWIGFEVLILSGVTIGDGAVVGARSVVSRDIPPYGIAVGSPAKVCKYRFEPKIIEKLLATKWWNWEDEKVKEFAPMLMSSRMEAFLNAVEGKGEKS